MFITGHLIRLFILIELILSPLIPHLSFIKSAHAQATSCPTGYVYDSGVNRCLLTEEAISAAETRNECMEKTGEERANCLANKANQFTGFDDKKCNEITDDDKDRQRQLRLACRNSRSKNGFWSANNLALSMATFSSVAGIGAAIKFKKKMPKCQNLSFYGIAGGGAAMMAGEVASIISFNKKIKEAKTTYDQLKLDATGVDTTDIDNTRTEAVNLQAAAFDVMIQKEQAMKAAAKTKQTAYSVAIGAYGVSAANAAMEMLQWKMARRALKTSIKIAIADATKQVAAGNSAALVADAALKTAFTLDGQCEIEEASQEYKDAITYKLDAVDRLESLNTIKNEKTKFNAWNKYSLPIDNNVKIIMSSGATILSAQKVQAAWLKLKTLREKMFCEMNAPLAVDYNPKDLPSLIKAALNELLISEAYADEIDDQLKKTGDLSSTWGMYTTGLVAGAGAGALISTQNFLSKSFETPFKRFTISGVMGGWATLMMSNAKKQQELADERIKILEDLKAKVTASGNSITCSSADRSDPANPRCYCYNPDNTRNDARGNSEVCSKEWGKAPSLYGKNQRKTYGPANQAGGCVNQQNQFDPQCRCKNNKGPKGGNSCMKSMGGMRFGFPQTATETNMASQAMDLINSGQYDNAFLNGFFNQSGAFRKKANAIVKAMKDPQTEKNLKEAEKALVSSLNSSIGGLNLSTPDAGANFAPGMSPKQALEEIKKEMKKPDPSNAPIFESGVASDSNASDDFNLNMGSDPAGGVEEVMAQNFDYGSNDISKDGSANIFDILSLRYKRSGLRRLFEGEKDSTPDAPNADEINP
jgi:hypothetical protein